jgi:HK97 gp10 family phage protein
MIRITARVEGLKECEEALRELTRATARNQVRKALQAAAQPVVDAAKANVVRNTGTLAEEIQVASRLKRGKRGGRKADVEVFAGPAGRRRASIAHLVEFGAAHLPPRAFLRPAVDSNLGRVIATFRRELKTNIDAAVARARRKAARTLAKIRKA